MTMSYVTNDPKLQPAIQTLLETLRRRIRQYVWFDGLASAFVWLGVIFWVSVFGDWLFEPSRGIRVVLLGVVTVGFTAILLRKIGRRAFTPLPNRSMAILLERRFPNFNEGLLTAVELSEQNDSNHNFSHLLLDHTQHQASEQIRGVRLSQVFNTKLLRQKIATLALLAVSIIGFTALFPTTASFWAKRCLGFSNELWPRRSRLIVEGFDKGLINVARGSNIEVVAKADTSMPVVPKVVEVRYQTKDGIRGRSVMSRDGIADPTKDSYQEYSYTFNSVLTPIEFSINGGDTTISDLRINVVDSPTIEMKLRCTFPSYMARKPRQLPVTGIMQVPYGTRVAALAEANKDLKNVQIDSAIEEKYRSNDTIHIPAKNTNRRCFEHTIDGLTEDTTLLFTLLDTDNIRSRKPIRLAMAVQPDSPPNVSLRLQGIGSAITPRAQLPIVGRITDDYGIAKAWFEYSIDKEKPKSKLITTPKTNQTELQLETPFDVQDLTIKPGQKLQVCVRASDRYNLETKPNIGSSESKLFRVVTPEKLRTILQSRELVLRQRFSMVIREVEETAGIITRINFGDRRPNSEAHEPDNPTNTRPQLSEPTPAERLLATQKLRIHHALQNSGKNAHEVLSIAWEFDNIRSQLINNRIDTEELKRRLGKGIVQPLRHIAKSMFPELEDNLRKLEATLTKPSGPNDRQSAITQVDEILTQMRQILNRMIELENFNEAIELLRSIIESQDELSKKTRELRNKKLQELLED